MCELETLPAGTYFDQIIYWRPGKWQVERDGQTGYGKTLAEAIRDLEGSRIVSHTQPQPVALAEVV